MRKQTCPIPSPPPKGIALRLKPRRRRRRLLKRSPRAHMQADLRNPFETSPPPKGTALRLKPPVVVLNVPL